MFSFIITSWIWWVERQLLVCLSSLRAEKNSCSSLPGSVSVHWLGGLDNREFIGKRFDPLGVLVTSTGKHDLSRSISDFWTEMKNRTSQTMLSFKKLSHWPQAATLPPWGRPTPPPPPCWSTSAPPWITFVVVLTSLAWCHSFFEFKSSPLWLEINVPSSTNRVSGFLYALRIVISK